ncbi:hypothetical protein APSETT445_008509 [Aspergillus pseudonomiae]
MHIRIHGYYPEIEDDKVTYYCWTIGKFHIWMDANKWACYRFVYNLDDMFLPSHIARVMDMLERIPEPQDIPLHVDLDDINESQSIIDSEGASEIRAMIQNLQQQMEQQKQEHKEVHAQLQQERREWSEREERLRAQFEQEKKEAQERLTAQLEGFAQTLNPK